MRIAVIGSFIQACCWMVERLPQPGETLTAGALSVEPGGKGLNVAIGVSRLGAQVDVLIGIGSDAAGDALVALLEKERLSSEHVWRLGPKSGHGAGFIAADGQNAIAIYSGANSMLSEHHIRLFESSLLKADIVYGQLETSLSAVTSAFRFAHRKGIPTVLNPSPWQALPGELMDCSDVLIVNEVETRELLSLSVGLKSSLDDCAETLKYDVDSFFSTWPGALLVITLGEKGSLAYERNGSIHCSPAFPIQAVDCTGSGDAFASAFCSALAQHRPFGPALRFANASGAFVASRTGVLNSLPTHEQLSAFIRSSG